MSDHEDDNGQRRSSQREYRGDGKNRSRDLKSRAKIFDPKYKQPSNPDFVAHHSQADMKPIMFGDQPLPKAYHMVNSTLTEEKQKSMTKNIKVAKANKDVLMEAKLRRGNSSEDDEMEYHEKATRIKSKSSNRQKYLLDEHRVRNEVKLSLSAMKQLINNTWTRKKKDLKLHTDPVKFQNIRGAHTIDDGYDPKSYRPPVNPKTEWQRNLITKALKKTFVLKNNHKKDKLVDAMEEVLIPKDGILYREGHNNTIEENQFYIVQEGCVIVQVDGSTVDTLKAGTAFGQERLLLQGQNQATVKATENSKLFKLDQQTFRKVMQAGEATAPTALPPPPKDTKKKSASTNKKSTSLSSTGTYSTDDDGGYDSPAPKKKKSGGSLPPKPPKSAPASQTKKAKASLLRESLHKDESKPKRKKSGDMILDAKVEKPSSSSAGGGGSGSGKHSNNNKHGHEKVKRTRSTPLDQMKGTANGTNKKKTVAAKKKNKGPKAKKYKTVMKKRMVLKPQKEWTLEDSPVYQQQLSLRDSVKKYAPNKENDLEFIKVLGEGQYGQVWLVAANLPDQNPTRHEFALKLQSKTDDMREDAVMEIKREILALQTLHHPFIANLVHTYESDDSIDMLMGLIKGGELWDTIHKQDPITEEWNSGLPEYQAKFYAYLLADTFQFLQGKEYVYRDLKPENVMLDSDGYPILVDFGFAKYVPETTKTFTFCGTPNYVSPETVRNVGHSYPSDHWALGVVIYEMVSGENPFFYDDMEQFELYQSISEEEPYPMGDDVDPSTEVLDLIDELLIKDPVERMDIVDVVKHRWFDGMPDLKKFRAKQVKAPVLKNGKVFYDVEPDPEPEYEEEWYEEQVTDDEGTDSDDEDRPRSAPSSPQRDRPNESVETKFETKPDGSTICTTITTTYDPITGITTTKTKMRLMTTDWRKAQHKRGYYAKMKTQEENEQSKNRRGKIKDLLIGLE